MTYRGTLLVILTIGFGLVTKARAQGPVYPTQVSLYPQVSAETNGMGGAGVSFVSDNALAVIANPAELGLFSLHGIMGVSYMPEIPRQLNAYAINMGLNLNRIFHGVPFLIGVGIGYSHPRYSYPLLNQNFQNAVQTDAANDITIGVGMDYLVKLGLGYTMKWANTTGAPEYLTYYKSAYSPDLGAILQFPIVNLLSKLKGLSTISTYGVRPIFNLTIGYSERNAGDYAPYGFAILPREGDLGWNFEAGLETDVAGHRWEWLSFTWLRQSDAPLVSSTGSFVYLSGLGNFHVSDNLIAGRPTDNVSVEKGWQLQLGQFIYLRGGSATGPEIPTYSTFGWGVKLDGLIKTLIFAHGIDQSGSLARFLLDHMDFQFSYSKANGEIVGYGNTTGIGFEGEPFESLTLVVR